MSEPVIVNPADVLSFIGDVDRPVEATTAKAEEVVNAVVEYLSSSRKWESDGIPCQLLQSNSEWRKGKAYLRIEFVEESEG